MAELLKLESRPSDFTLQWVDEKKPVRLGDLLRKWRVVLLFLSEDMYAENDVAESYLKFMRDAKVRFGDLAKRDVTLCVIHPYVRSRSALPSPTDFQVLNDPDGKVAAMYGRRARVLSYRQGRRHQRGTTNLPAPCRTPRHD